MDELKQLILESPIILFFLVAIGLLYFFIIFHYSGRNSKLSSAIEILFFGILVFSISGATGATISPFDKLHPRVLMSVTTTLPTIAGQIGFYGIILCMIISRLRYTLKDYINILSIILVKAPFFCLFLLLATLSFFWSNVPIITLRNIVVLWEITFFAIYFAKQYEWKFIYQFWLWLNIIVVMFSIFYALKEGQGGTWHGILGHKNQFSFFMAQTTVLWLMYGVYNRKRRRLSLAFSALSFFSLIKGDSGASKVLMVMLLSLWGYFGFVKKLKVQWAVVSVILFMIVSICATIVVTENIKFIVVDTLNKDLTLTGRTDFWPIIVNKINEHPVVGYGLSGFWQPWREGANPALDIVVVKTDFRPGHSHNGFLDLGLELGYLGLALFACSFFNNIAKGVLYLSRTQLPESGLPLLLLTYNLMTNLTETGLVGITSIWFWYVVTTVRVTLDTTPKYYGAMKHSVEATSFPVNS
jgi:O-antigen ligase